MPVSTLRGLPLGKVLLSLVAPAAPVAAIVADWNETHVHNPRWPPHATFHNAPTIVTSAGLAALAWWQLWVHRPWSRPALRWSALLASLYWLTQAPAALFPGTALVDPEFADLSRTVAGVPLNQITGQLAVLYPMVLAAYRWESRRVEEHTTGPTTRQIPTPRRQK